MATSSSTRRLFAFLRAVNVGGHNIAMAELRRLFLSLGLKEVETFIASGNVIFNSDARDLRTVEIMLEDCLRKALNYEVTAFIRTEQDLASIARYKPFEESQLQAAQAINVGFLLKPPGSAAKKAITAFNSEIDDFHVHGREVYWLCRTKQSDSKFSNARFEKLLKARATWRSANTIRRLATKYARS